ncbi:MAG: NAD(P)H-binding protein [Bradyrhizobium sp.]|nr:NAD(P)H-binding protein [Bradyrhizobium sp.]
MVEDIQHSSDRSRIAIAGSTGRVGGALTKILEADPVHVVALTRRPDEVKFSPGVTVSTVNFEAPSTLREAMRGADRLFLAHGGSPQQVANEIALIDAAIASGVRHIVKLSAMGPATRLYPFAWHMEIEAHLARQPVASTVLRPSAFADLLKRSASQIASGTWANAAGDGPVNFIDTRDVADAARVALLEAFASESQRAYHLTGSRTWTMEQVAETLSGLLGREVTYRYRSPEEERTALAAAGLPPLIVDVMVGLDQVCREHGYREITSTFKDMTGKEARPLTGWLSENIGLFRKLG